MRDINGTLAVALSHILRIHPTIRWLNGILMHFPNHYTITVQEGDSQQPGSFSRNGWDIPLELLRFGRIKGLTCEGITPGHADALTAISHNGSLTSIDLGFNEIVGEAARTLASVVLNRPTTLETFCNIPIRQLRANELTDLDIPGKHICVPGALVLARLLSVSTSLTSLILWGNDIGNEGAKAVADALRVNDSLTSLSLQNNDLDAEGASAIVVALRVNSSLASLNLKGNSVGAGGAAAIANALGDNASLTSLNLASTQLCGLDFKGDGTYTAEGIKAVADALRVSASLTFIDMERNRLGDKGAKVIGSALKGMEMRASLTSLNLQQNIIGAEGATAIADALRANGLLKSLDLRYNPIGGYVDADDKFVKTPEGPKAITNALRGNASLTCCNVLSINMDVDAAKSLVEAVKDKTISLCDIKSDQLDFSNSDSSDAILLASDLSKADVSGSLRSLDLKQNRVGVEGAKAIADALRVNDSLTFLDLSANNLTSETVYIKATEVQGDSFNEGDKVIYQGREMIISAGKKKDEDLYIRMRPLDWLLGIEAIANALRINSSLTSLDLSFNALCGITTDLFGRQSGFYSAEGIKAIADALGANASLTSLDLKGTEIDDDGARVISESLTRNNSLMSLDLSWNRIGVEGAEAMGKSLHDNGSLTSLNLYNNDIGDEGAKALIAELADDSSLTKLDMRNNNIGDGQALQEAVKRRAGFSLLV